ncbi:hypothetical protein MINS_12180 [Mycolicibacterium insubricum]|uniref:Uncharacterized protein n=1 Tax=Mycolicibacterium insubricum TaxID=444597 RepID=A0A1X0CKY4_9MYCO|nr:DUF2637 domain-containing protein [Mycolicibacterium insubricum]MCV7084115.1 DUF2637 domain-containing protein [Mycolicibacterium insubricum]ORA60784.1 hypothetical protein BST26_21420 [Mycolicibacterium insubricum]BBZ65789.1 hypothetical protein MINS_12180 [Mycolicibacterium insubricum]
MTATDSARRFFWCWLLAASTASIAGNVTHALLHTTGTPAIAAAAAVVPPVVLLAATHGVHTLVHARITGAAYRTALCITAALALCAFVLSFTALRDLAITAAGIPPQIAWLWPLAIDLSITASTVALLALTNAHRVTWPAETAGQPVVQAAQNVHVSVHNDMHTTPDSTPERPTVAQIVARETTDQWTAMLPEAESVIAAGITRIDRVKVAQVLAAADTGTAPSAIARNLGVGYSTVTRILDHTEQEAHP